MLPLGACRRWEIAPTELGETIMNLAEIVEKYLTIAGGFGFLSALADFGLDREQAERIFGVFDEDYHISRYFHFSEVSGPALTINGFNQTHVTIDEDIQSIL